MITRRVFNQSAIVAGVAAFFAPSCKEEEAIPKDHHTRVMNDPNGELLTLFESFKNESESRGVYHNPHGKAVDIYFQENEFEECPDCLGATIHHYEDWSNVQFVSSKWQEAPLWRRELSFFHEMGHAFFNYSHKRGENLRKIRIMELDPIEVSIYKWDREEMLNELFGV